MKPFVLYDLINNTEQVILRPERVALYNPPVRKKYSRKRAMKRFLRVQQGRRACVSIVRLWKASARNWMNRLMLENVEWYRFLRHIRDAGVC